MGGCRGRAASHSARDRFLPGPVAPCRADLVAARQVAKVRIAGGGPWCTQAPRLSPSHRKAAVDALRRARMKRNRNRACSIPYADLAAPALRQCTLTTPGSAESVNAGRLIAIEPSPLYGASGS